MKKIWLFFSFLFLFCGHSYASSLSIETDYRLRGIFFSNNDFNPDTSTDSIKYYSQRLQIGLIGKFDQGIEIGSKITALGVSASTNTPFFSPHQKTDFTPYVQNAYIKINNLADAPLDLIVGKQSVVYGDGFLISDNGQGFNAIRIMGSYDKFYLPLEGEFLTAKIAENFKSKSDRDLYGGLVTTKYKEHKLEIGYFEDRDFSGTIYKQGLNECGTKCIVKKFYDIRVGKREKISAYQFELVKQKGYIKKTDDSKINLNGMGYLAYGELIGEKTKLGKVKARSLLMIASGDNNTLSLDDDDESFSPGLTRKYDGLERTGYGELFAATPMDSFFELPDSYSGINTLSVGAVFSPIYAWDIDLTYFLYSASEGPRGAPTASGFERLFGAEYALGVELDIGFKYKYTKYVELKFGYNRYTPPKFETFWPFNKPATRYLLEANAKF